MLQTQPSRFITQAFPKSLPWIMCHYFQEVLYEPAWVSRICQMQTEFSRQTLKLTKTL